MSLTNNMSYSQFRQDLWVLSYFQTGIFVDVGFADGVVGNNTVLLDIMGWKGLGIDLFPKNYASRTNTTIETACIYKNQEEVTFSCAGDWGGISQHIDKCKDMPEVIGSKKITTTTQTLDHFLVLHNFPNKIEYLSLDTEGSEYEILSTFPFDKYTFGCITYEHNHEEEKRNKVRKLLESKEYIFDRNLVVDDCFIHNSVKNGTFK